MPIKSFPFVLPLFLQNRGRLHAFEQRIKPGLRTVGTVDFIKNVNHTLVSVIFQELFDSPLKELAPGDAKPFGQPLNSIEEWIGN